MSYFQCFIWYGLLALSLSYPIFNFIIHETSSGTLLEFIRVTNKSIYNASISSSSPVIVVLLTNNQSQKFEGLKNLTSNEVVFITEWRQAYKLKTPQIHVLIRPTHANSLPGIVKFMSPLKKMNMDDIANFINTSIAIEKEIISPNIDKILCFPDQQLALMRTVLGKYSAFTMYVINWTKKKTLISTKDSDKKYKSTIDLPPAAAKQILNPVPCDTVFDQGIINIDI
ncbi:unnamed protein product [Thelazia callipaeda]|uniref:Serpin domain-containing protein n=1 Tax=Thelazia callipaeda TaxID=103827 RepID=A0A0N5D4G3_THECL|nr:unnamed protein product [Thelazia callipaeda]